MQERLQRAGVDRRQGLLARQRNPSSTASHVEADRGLRRALGVARLEHVQAAFLDRELRVLHVAVVRLERAQDLHQLRVGFGHHLGELGDVARRTAPDTTSSPCALTRKSPLGSCAPVTSLREKATPDPDVAPLLPNTICCTLTAVPQSSGIRFRCR